MSFLLFTVLLLTLYWLSALRLEMAFMAYVVSVSAFNADEIQFRYHGSGDIRALLQATSSMTNHSCISFLDVYTNNGITRNICKCVTATENRMFQIEFYRHHRIIEKSIPSSFSFYTFSHVSVLATSPSHIRIFSGSPYLAKQSFSSKVQLQSKLRR